jgi:hypothetical protein
MSNHLIFCWAVPRGSERGCELVYRIGGVEAEERTTIGTTNKKQESLRQSRAAVESLYDIILSRRVSRPWNCYSDSAGGDCWLEVRRNYREGGIERAGGRPILCQQLSSFSCRTQFRRVYLLKPLLHHWYFVAVPRTMSVRFEWRRNMPSLSCHFRSVKWNWSANLKRKRPFLYTCIRVILFTLAFIIPRR